MFHVERWQINVSRGTNDGVKQKMFHVERFVKKIKIFNLRTINKNNLVVS